MGRPGERISAEVLTLISRRASRFATKQFDLHRDMSLRYCLFVQSQDREDETLGGGNLIAFSKGGGRSATRTRRLGNDLLETTALDLSS
jgi:hypothetical protein